MKSIAMYIKIYTWSLEYFEINTLDEIELDAKYMGKNVFKKRGEGGILGKVFHCVILDPVV